MLIPEFKAIYVADPDYLSELCAELSDNPTVIGNLVFSSIQKPSVSFALDIWLQPQVIHFESISEAARVLRQAGKYWHLNPIENVRRSHLIAAELRKRPELPHEFPIRTEYPDIGCFSLLDKNTLAFSTKRWKSAPLGDFQFIEDKKNPPNRAYLKLWEALSLLGQLPNANDFAIDLGAAPGGWSYVMHSLGCEVLAIDKAELDPAIAKLPRMSFKKDSAFAIEPETIQKEIDWLLCDVACYPERLYELVIKWIASNKARQMIFTIKLQGETDLGMLEKFKAIPGARVIHLMQNKHEATFFYPAPASLFPQF